MRCKAAAYTEVEAYPLDVLGAQTEGMIGYMIEQELGNLLPFEVPFATILTMVEVDPNDPAFQNPTKFVGPVYDQAQADQLAGEKGWVFKQDGNKWRRVVPSPLPKRIFEHPPDQMVAGKEHDRHLRRRRRHPHHVRPGQSTLADRRRGGDRQRPGQRLCSPANWRPISL